MLFIFIIIIAFASISSFIFYYSHIYVYMHTYMSIFKQIYSIHRKYVHFTLIITINEHLCTYPKYMMYIICVFEKSTIPISIAFWNLSWNNHKVYISIIHPYVFLFTFSFAFYNKVASLTQEMNAFLGVKLSLGSNTVQGLYLPPPLYVDRAIWQVLV